MMNSQYSFSVALLLVGTISGRAFEDMHNSIGKPNIDRSFVNMPEALPPKFIQRVGKIVEIQCVGQPLPTVHWIRGNNPHNIIDKLDLDMVAEIVSRLIIEDTSVSGRVFTCVGRAGNKTINATTTIVSAPGYNKSELLSKNNGAMRARIVHYNTFLFNFIGSNITLPCKTAGPATEIYWQFNDNYQFISGQDKRMRVLPSGSLTISSLEWSDMGECKCIWKRFHNNIRLSNGKLTNTL